MLHFQTRDPVGTQRCCEVTRHLKYYEIEGNSKILIRILKKQIPAPRAIRIINHTHDNWYFLQNYTHVSFQHIYREANMIADLLYNIFHHLLMSISYIVNFDLYDHHIHCGLFWNTFLLKIKIKIARPECHNNQRGKGVAFPSTRPIRRPIAKTSISLISVVISRHVYLRTPGQGFAINHLRHLALFWPPIPDRHRWKSAALTLQQ